MTPLQAAAIAAVVAAFLLSGCQAAPPAQAAEATPKPERECALTIGKVQDTLKSRFKDLKEIILSGADKDNFLKAFNSADPPTNFTAHRVHMFHSRRANINRNPDTTVLTMVDADECVKRNGEVRTKDVVNWLPTKV